MKVKAKVEDLQLIKDEWYEVIDGTGNYLILQNHTHKIWRVNWFLSFNFYTAEEIRDLKLKELGIR